MKQGKVFEIPKALVWQSYQQVRKNKGAAGSDGQTLKEFDENRDRNLYKIWNRLSSGSYFPPPVLEKTIPKGDGKERTLGIPTVADRVPKARSKSTWKRSWNRSLTKTPTGIDRTNRPMMPLRSANEGAGATVGSWKLISKPSSTVCAMTWCSRRSNIIKCHSGSCSIVDAGWKLPRSRKLASNRLGRGNWALRKEESFRHSWRISFFTTHSISGCAAANPECHSSATLTTLFATATQ